MLNKNHASVIIEKKIEYWKSDCWSDCDLEYKNIEVKAILDTFRKNVR
jgi:hypothetical protein